MTWEGMGLFVFRSPRKQLKKYLSPRRIQTLQAWLCERLAVNSPKLSKAPNGKGSNSHQH